MNNFMKQEILAHQEMEKMRTRFLEVEVPKIREGGGTVEIMMDEVIITLPKNKKQGPAKNKSKE